MVLKLMAQLELEVKQELLLECLPEVRLKLVFELEDRIFGLELKIPLEF